MGIYSFQSNLTVRNSIFSDIGFYNAMNTNQNSNAIGIKARSNTTDIKQTTIIGTKEKPGLNTFSNCYNDIETVGTHLSVSGVVSYRSGECIYAKMSNSMQNPITVNIKDNDLTFFHSRGIFVNYFKPITLNIRNNYLSDNNEMYDPISHIGIEIKGGGFTTAGHVFNNQIRSNGILAGGGFRGIILDGTPYMIVEQNNIYEKLPSSSLFSFIGIRNNAAPSNGLRLYSNTVNGAKIDYAGYSAGIMLFESMNTQLNCNETNRVNGGITFLSNCDNATLAKNKFNYHAKGLSLGDDAFAFQLNIIGLQHANENRWFGTSSPIEAYALNQTSALGSIFEVNNSTLSSDYWPSPRKIGTVNDNFTWFKTLMGQGPSNDFSCLTTETPLPPCDNCEYQLADSDIRILNGTYIPPLNYPALDWEAHWHFADRLNRNAALQGSSSTATQYFQNTYNYSYSKLNRIYQNYRNCWQPGGSLAENVHSLSAYLQSRIDQRFKLDEMLSENWEENGTILAQMVDTDEDIADATEALVSASTDFVNLVNQNVSALLQSLESVNCPQSYEMDMKSVIRTTLQTHFTNGELNEQQSGEMAAIAGKCRYLGGYATALARAFFEPRDSYGQDAHCDAGERSAGDIVKVDKMPGIGLYPNPASATLNISIDRDFEAAMVKVYNSQGVLQKELAFIEKNTQFSVADLSPGFYVTEIILDGKSSHHRTFIKID